RSGHAAPAVGDFYGDGKPALLVGQFSGGKLRVYRNTGTAGAPKFGDFEWFKASDALGTIQPGGDIGFCPPVVDLRGDGKADIISGSWPGPITLFRRTADGFAGGETLKHEDGTPVNPANGSHVFAFDWDGDGKLDLIIGTSGGEVLFVPNVGTRDKPVFG